MARLVFLGEKFSGRVYELAVEKTSVGRGEHNTLTIQDSSVSDRHCEILLSGREVIVRDLGSRNGTIVNGRRLSQQQCELLHGQIVKFGGVEARLELPPPSTSDTMSDVTAVRAHVQILKNQESKRAEAEKISFTLDDDTKGDPAEHTMILPHSTPESASKPLRPEPDVPRKSRLRVWIIASVLVALAILVWVLLRRG